MKRRSSGEPFWCTINSISLIDGFSVMIVFCLGRQNFTVILNEPSHKHTNTLTGEKLLVGCSFELRYNSSVSSRQSMILFLRLSHEPQRNIHFGNTSPCLPIFFQLWFKLSKNFIYRTTRDQNFQMALHIWSICVASICGLLFLSVVGSENVEGSLGNNYDPCDDSNISPVLRSRLCGSFFERMPTERNNLI